MNRDLIETYKAVRLNHKTITKKLWDYHHQHQQDPEWYYIVRAEEPTKSNEIAARFIYLNRTCFNGIYRVNRDGKFNVPRGGKTQVMMPDDDWHGWSVALQSVELLYADFQPMLDQAEKGDFLFVDPPTLFTTI
ncbi:MAG: DNA adenine methylase [Pseudomonadota bacterium]|nr:DNA adenine methylase [Pseudomonadota bacterium]